MLSGSQLYYKTINCEKNKIQPFVQLQRTIASLPHQKNTLMSNWHLIQHLQRKICKNWTFISYILVRGKTLWSHNTHYRACTSCLACQHFDFNSTDWFSHNLHMSSSWYLWTMGKESNQLFQQTFVEQKHATNPKNIYVGGYPTWKWWHVWIIIDHRLIKKHNIEMKVIKCNKFTSLMLYIQDLQPNSDKVQHILNDKTSIMCIFDHFCHA